MLILDYCATADPPIQNILASSITKLPSIADQDDECDEPVDSSDCDDSDFCPEAICPHVSAAELDDVSIDISYFLDFVDDDACSQASEITPPLKTSGHRPPDRPILLKVVKGTLRRRSNSCKISGCFRHKKNRSCTKRGGKCFVGSQGVNS